MMRQLYFADNTLPSCNVYDVVSDEESYHIPQNSHTQIHIFTALRTLHTMYPKIVT